MCFEIEKTFYSKELQIWLQKKPIVVTKNIEYLKI
jgi:hypothetical protein